MDWIRCRHGQSTSLARSRASLYSTMARVNVRRCDCAPGARCVVLGSLGLLYVWNGRSPPIRVHASAAVMAAKVANWVFGLVTGG